MKYVFAGLTLVQMVVTGAAMYMPEFSKDATFGCWVLSIIFAVLTCVACAEEW